MGLALVRIEPIGGMNRHQIYLNDIPIGEYVSAIDVRIAMGEKPTILLSLNARLDIPEDLELELSAKRHDHDEKESN